VTAYSRDATDPIGDAIWTQMKVKGLSACEVAHLAEIPVSEVEKSLHDPGKMTLPPLLKISVALWGNRSGLLEAWGARLCVTEATA
jgi:hypothetical protein